MSASTLIGLIASIALCAIAILASTDDARLFFSLPSLVLVVGGTMASAFASYQARYVWRALGALGRVALSQRSVRRELPTEVGKVIRWGYLAKSQGLKAPPSSS
jgi:chemotaxis protein MotA